MAKVDLYDLDNTEYSQNAEDKALLNILEDMKTDKKQLEDQRTAIFNILEDNQK